MRPTSLRRSILACLLLAGTGIHSVRAQVADEEYAARRKALLASIDSGIVIANGARR